MKIRLLTLGTPACFISDQEIADILAQKTRFALLVYLAVERDVSRDQAAAVFWPDRDDERARHALSQSVYELKRSLGDGWLETPAGRLVVTDQLVVDAAQFTAFCDDSSFDKAVSLYRGPFLADFYLPNCKAFETWVDRQRSNFERAHRKARREHVQELLQANRVQDALIATRRWVELEPFEDEANHKLIELLAQHGSRADALKQYEFYEKRLKEELEIEPLDHTKALVTELRAETSNGSPFTIAVSAAEGTGPESRRPHTRRNIATAVVMAAVLAAVYIMGALRGLTARNTFDPTTLDTALFAIMPFKYADNVSQRLYENQLMRGALTHWSGIKVVDEYLVQAALDRRSREHGTNTGLWAARDVKAARYFLGDVTRFGGVLRVHAGMYDAVTDQPVSDLSVDLPLTLNGADSVFQDLTDKLLYGPDVAMKSSGLESSVTSRSWPARRAFARGQEAIREWNLARADSAFTDAARLDPDFATALLWLAQVRLWNGGDRAQMRFVAERAYAESMSLDASSRGRARALVSFAHGELAHACDEFRSLTRREPHGFASWYSLATCLRIDDGVVDAADSPTGKRFRSSYQEAAIAYQNAFRIYPSSLRALRGNSYLTARRWFFTESNSLRSGHGVPPDATIYGAFPRAVADTVAFTPFPLNRMMEAYFKPDEIRRGRLLQQNLFKDIAEGWRTIDPRSSDALEAVAVAFEMLGDRNAIDTLEAARAVADEPEKLLIVTTEVFALAKFALPDDERSLNRLVALSDSLFRSNEHAQTVNAGNAAAVAMLRGHLSRAATFLAAEDVRDPENLPPAVAEITARLTLFAAAGVPTDSILNLQQMLMGALGAADQSVRESVKIRGLLRATWLAWPIVDPRVMSWVSSTNFQLIRAQSAFAQGYFPAVRALLDSIRASNAGLNPQDLTFDVLVPEASLLARLGDGKSAAAWLDPSLNSLTLRSPRALADPIQVTALMRAMVLRADIAAANRDWIAAARWARPVAVLWKNADAELQPAVRRMRRHLRSAER
jgi:DNA-binding SARP family transcriptional activator